MSDVLINTIYSTLVGICLNVISGWINIPKHWRKSFVIVTIISIVIYVSMVSHPEYYTLTWVKSKIHLTTSKPKAQGAYQYADSYSEGLSMVELNNKWGFINERGDEVVPIKYDWAEMFFPNGLAAVGLGNPRKYGYINKAGKVVIDIKYDGCGVYFSEGLAPVEINGKWGFINEKGKEIIPIIYNRTGYGFDSGIIAVQLGERWFYINKKGEYVRETDHYAVDPLPPSGYVSK